jgi:O-antigen/teichoic acid export membrane protein
LTSIRQFARDSLFNLIQQGWSIVIGLLISIFLARGLGSQERGAYASVLLLSNIVVLLLNSGIEPSIIFHTARSEFSLAVMIPYVLNLTLGIGLAGVAFALVIILASRQWLFPNLSTQDLLMGVAVIPVVMLTLNLEALFRGMQDFKTYNWIESISQLMALLLTIVLVWWLQLGLAGGIVAILCRYGLAIGIMFHLLRRHPDAKAVRWLQLPDRKFFSTIFGYGLKVYSYNLVTFLNQRADVLLLNVFGLSLRSIGLYDLGVSLAEKLWSLSRAVSMVTFSRISALEHNETEQNLLTVLFSRYVFWFGLMAALLTFLLIDPVVMFLYGSEYALAATGLKLLLPGVVMLGFAHVLSNDISGRGKPEILTFQSLCGLVLNFVLNLILIPRWDFFGAAISSSISYTVMALWLTETFCRLTGTKWYSMFILTQADWTMLKKFFQTNKQ